MPTFFASKNLKVVNLDLIKKHMWIFNDYFGLYKGVYRTKCPIPFAVMGPGAKIFKNKFL